MHIGMGWLCSAKQENKMQIDVEELKKLAPEGALESVTALVPNGPVYLFNIGQNIEEAVVEVIRKHLVEAGIRGIVFSGLDLKIYELKTNKPQ